MRLKVLDFSFRLKPAELTLKRLTEETEILQSWDIDVK